MAWPWGSSHDGRGVVVDCHFCATKLDLVTAVSYDPHGKGKGKAIAYDQPVAVGTRQDWICGYCACRNHFDQNDIIISDEPAHHDAQLNLESFSRRGYRLSSPRLYDAATPSKAHITSPTPEKLAPFCRSCLSNQSLQIHLLASYDLDSDNLASTSATSSSPASVSAYRQSLDRRYPIVCSTCLPSVETIIKQRDYRAKTSLFGSRLRESQRAIVRMGDTSTRRISLWTVLIWRLRAVLWYSTWMISIVANALALWDPTWPNRPCPLPLVLGLASSLLWINWDPTWLELNRSKVLKHRRLRTRGRRMYISIQMLAYGHRLGLALSHHLRPGSIILHTYPISLALQVFLFALSFYAIRLVPRAQVRLGPSRPIVLPTSPAASPTTDPLEPIENLSISSDLAALFPSPTTTSSHHIDSTPNPKPAPKTLKLSASLLRQRLNPEPKFGDPWIQASPNSVNPHPNDQDGDVEMSDAELDCGAEGRKKDGIEFGKSKVRWGWNEPSSGLDEVFEERMRVDDKGSSERRGQTQNRANTNTSSEGRFKWLGWFGG
ncbi:BQ2448_3792 [Microbotryum intermedium]|uniref:BQ2448_3792 protein n=1 Tax=Microbotryum intermedium TaxID=269621 RepID=A0A238FB02_9BASI|nr:BQ2448_3792 [Microbotryum intermedium]